MAKSFLNVIDNTDKAYCLGFFSYIIDTHSKYATNSYEFSNIYIEEDKEILDLCKNVVDIFNDEKSEIVSMTVIDSNVLNDIIINLKNFDINNWNDKMKKEFIRGLYDYNYLNNENDTENILIKRTSYLNDILPKIGDYLKIPYVFTKQEDDKTEYLTYMYGCSTSDFLGTIYNEINCNSFSFKAANYNLTLPKCYFIRVDNNAVVPSKENWSDVGYDLSIINKIKDFNYIIILIFSSFVARDNVTYFNF